MIRKRRGGVEQPCLCVQEVRNTVGNIPLEWYEDYPHLGYDQEGVAITKPPQRDEVCHTPYSLQLFISVC